MTTLPSTTNPQLPQRRMNLPAAAMMPLPAAHSGEGQNAMTMGDIWRIIRSNILLIIGCLFVFGTAGYFVNRLLMEHMPQYTAEGYLRVDREAIVDPQNVLQKINVGNSGNDLSVEQQSQATILQSQWLWAEVLQMPNSNLRKTQWFQSFKASDAPDAEPDAALAKADLAKHFQVTPFPNSKLIRVRMTAEHPSDARVVLEQIVNKHLLNQDQALEKTTRSRATALQGFKNRYDIRISDLNRLIAGQRSQLIQSGGNSSDQMGFNAKQFELNRLMGRLLDSQQQQEIAQGMRDAIVAQLNQGQVPSSVQTEIDQDPTVLRYQQYVDGLEMQLLTNKKLGENHESYKSLLEQKALYADKLNQRRAEVSARATDRLMQALQSQLSASQAGTDGVRQRISEVKTELGELAASTAVYMANQDELAVLRQMLDRVNQQLDAINTAADVQNLNEVKWAIHPVEPESPSFPKLRNTMAVSILLALGFSVGIAFLRELTDTTVRSPRDLAKVGPMTLLGMIPHDDDDRQSTGVALPLVMSQAPHSIIAEQFRQVRTRLHHTAGLETTRTIVVTSPGPGDGKTVVAVNLASGLALNGRKILLVDANFRRPALHEVFDIPNEAGFAACLDNVANLLSAVQHTEVPNLDVLPTGQRPTNATELLESQLLNDFMDRALEEYDHIIFDTGPMLVVSETVALAPRVDGVISVVRARTNTRGLLGRMKTQLEQLNANHLGVVLNAVRNQAGGYYNRSIKTYYAYNDA